MKWSLRKDGVWMFGILFWAFHIAFEPDCPELSRPLASALASALVCMSIQAWELRNELLWYKQKRKYLEEHIEDLKQELDTLKDDATEK